MSLNDTRHVESEHRNANTLKAIISERFAPPNWSFLIVVLLSLCLLEVAFRHPRQFTEPLESFLPGRAPFELASAEAYQQVVGVTRPVVCEFVRVSAVPSSCGARELEICFQEFYSKTSYKCNIRSRFCEKI